MKKGSKERLSNSDRNLLDIRIYDKKPSTETIKDLNNQLLSLYDEIRQKYFNDVS